MIDFQTICRLCLSETGTINIFHSEDSTNCIDEKIMFCGRLKVIQSDGLPPVICTDCAAKLDTSYYFRLQIESSDHKLRELQKSQERDTVPKARHEIQTQTDDNITEAIQSKDILKEDPIIDNSVDESLKTPVIQEEENKQQSNKDESCKTLYQCDTCGKICSKKSQLVVHMRTHTGEKPFNCTLCDKAFTVRHHLTAHSRIHTSEKPYQCLYCGKCFSERSSLSRHTKIHTNEKKFVCTHCDKKFIRPADLKKHFVKHTGEKPFFCGICNKRYSDMSNFSKHNKTHRLEDAQKDISEKKVNNMVKS